MTAPPVAPPETTDADATPPELGLFALLRWAWRQLTSMRTALVLLLLLALAAVPGSIVPQSGVDAAKTARWQEAHPTLTTAYDKLGLFSVYSAPWFAAIYLLLVVSLVGCILPRLGVYWRSLRARPPHAPRQLSRLPGHAAYRTDETPAEVLTRAATALRRRRFRVAVDDDAVCAERGFLREAGNLVFHLALLVVLAGFAAGSLYGFRGGVLVLVDNGFTNNLTQYDDFAPGPLFDPGSLDDFSLTIDGFDVEWINSGPSRGLARNFVSHLSYREGIDAPTESYDLRVNHPLTIADTDVFLIGHGYAPVITIRDAAGHVSGGPTPFLPENPTMESFGVVKAPDARPDQLGLEGLFYPSYLLIDGDPVNVRGQLDNPTLSMLVYAGDLGLDSGVPQSVYVLDKSHMEMLKKPDGRPFRIDLQLGDTVRLPGGRGTVTFEGVREWNRLQVSSRPGQGAALGGVIVALLGLLASLYVRPRRVWVRARRDDDATTVEVAVLDRSGETDLDDAVAEILALVTGSAHGRTDEKEET